MAATNDDLLIELIKIRKLLARQYIDDTFINDIDAETGLFIKNKYNKQ